MENRMKVVTLTLNPAVDLIIRVERLTPGKVHRSVSSFTRAGGKGVNVGANIAGYGGMEIIAGGFLGCDNAGLFERHFAASAIQDRFIRLKGENRTNIKIVDPAGTTDVNLPGFSVGPEALERLLATVESLVPEGRGMAVLAGSLPPGCPPDLYRVLVGKLKTPRRPVFLDADGAALKHALAADSLPDCIKPNIGELSEWVGRPLKDEGDICAVVRGLLERGLKLAVVSLGSEGALLVNRTQAVHAVGRPGRILSAAGAGDAMMAGVVSAWAGGFGNPAGDLEYLAKRSSAFALAWLENGAPEEEGERSSSRNRFRETVDAAMDRIIVRSL